MGNHSHLERYIREHRHQFDAGQPPDGHFDRFRAKLDQKPVRRISIRHWLQVAASVAIILASGFVIIRHDRSGSRVAVKEIPATVLEADHYYAHQLEAKYERIKDFSFENREEKALLLNELEDLDAYHRQLMIDLQANPDDERVINALIRHYQLKLELMDQIIDQLEQLKIEKSAYNEKENV
jgi:hypothetical protein